MDVGGYFWLKRFNPKNRVPPVGNEDCWSCEWLPRRRFDSQRSSNHRSKHNSHRLENSWSHILKITCNTQTRKVVRFILLQLLRFKVVKLLATHFLHFSLLIEFLVQTSVSLNEIKDHLWIQFSFISQAKRDLYWFCTEELDGQKSAANPHGEHKAKKSANRVRRKHFYYV